METMSGNNKTVAIWNFFEKSGSAAKMAKCNYCRNDFSYKTTITNLKKHLKQKHGAVYTKFVNLRESLLSGTSSEPTTSPFDAVSIHFLLSAFYWDEYDVAGDINMGIGGIVDKAEVLKISKKHESMIKNQYQKQDRKLILCWGWRLKRAITIFMFSGLELFEFCGSRGTEGNLQAHYKCWNLCWGIF